MTALNSGERFVFPTIEQVERVDPQHVRRYRMAADLFIKRGCKSVVDVGCGCGYGSRIMHGAGMRVVGVDNSVEAVQYATEHYPGPAFATEIADGDVFDAATCFDVLEHVADPVTFARNIAERVRFGGYLAFSVPTQRTADILSSRGMANDHHERHYTAAMLIEHVGLPVYHLSHQKRHLGTGSWHDDCGIYAAFRKVAGRG